MLSALSTQPYSPQTKALQAILLLKFMINTIEETK